DGLTDGKGSGSAVFTESVRSTGNTLANASMNAGAVPSCRTMRVDEEKIWRKVVQKSTRPGMIARPDAHAW
uniref:hypothetical protein n=1 Tax=Pseudomonas atacamensis TaxID=2565368 RepID=UPI002B1CF5FF